MSTPPFLDLPPGVSATTVASGRGELAALLATPAQRTGAPVVLVPGYTGSKEDFIAVLAPIAAAGHPVLALDQLGQHQSPGSADPARYDLPALAADVLAVTAALADGAGPVHLVGHSFGGLVARAATLADPGLVCSLTLLGSGPAAIPAPGDASIRLLAQVLPVMDLESIWVAKRQMELDGGWASPRAEIEAWLHARFVANHPVGLLRCAETLLTEADRTGALRALDLPVLVLYGDQDDVWPPGLQAEMATRLGAEVAVLPGVGHSPAADAPEETAAALLAFWSTLATDRR